MFTKILLASDGSEGSIKAAAAAASMASRFKAELLVVHAVTLPTSLVPLVDAPGVGMDRVALDRYAQEELGAMADRTAGVLKSADVPYRTVSEIGHAAESIVRVAESERCNLIVLGSRGLGTIRSLLLGSVSDRVAHLAHCPVLIVR